MTQRPEILLYLALVAATVLAVARIIDGGDWLGFVGGLVGGGAIGVAVNAPAARIRRAARRDASPLEQGRWTR